MVHEAVPVKLGVVEHELCKLLTRLFHAAVPPGQQEYVLYLVKLVNIQRQPVDYIYAIAWRILYVLLHEAAEPREVCRDAETEYDALRAFYFSTWGCP